MSFLKTTFSKFASKKHADLFFILFVFLILRLITAFVFYNGFTINFIKIASLFQNEYVKSALLYVPYHGSSVCFGSLLHPFVVLSLLFICFPLLHKYKGIQQLRVATTDKILLVVSSFLLSWELSTYNFNYYLNNGFYLDRLLLVVFPFLLWRWQFLAPVYVALALVYRSQFNYPVDGFELFDKRLLFDILLMFTSWMYIKAYFKNSKINFIYLVLCIIASNYFISGFAKFLISPHGYEWLLQNKVSDLFLNVHARGWLANQNAQSVSSIYTLLTRFDVLFQSVVLIIELLALLLLRSKKMAILLLIAFCLMHLAIFSVGSMLFWKWMSLDLVVAYILYKTNSEFSAQLFSRDLFYVSLIVIGTSFIWLRPYPIGWFDTKANQFFTYEVEDESGRITELNKNDFNPYHQWIQYDRFLFLVNQNVLPISGFGYTGNYYFKELIDTTSPVNLGILQNKLGINHYEANKKQAFDKFVKTFFRNWNNAEVKNKWWTMFKAPNHLYNSAKNSHGLSDVLKVKKLRIIMNVSYISDNKSSIISRAVIDEIII